MLTRARLWKRKILQADHPELKSESDASRKPAAMTSTPASTTSTSIEEREALEAALQAISDNNQLASPFLRLPGEIRNTIYHYAMAGNEIYAVSRGSKIMCMGRPASQFAWKFEPMTEIMAFHLPLVCRQIRLETGKYFTFKFNTFGSTMPEDFSQLVARFTDDQKARIETVKMNFVRRNNTFSHSTPYLVTVQPGSPFRILTVLPSLKRLVLRDLSTMDEVEKERLVMDFKKVPEFERLEVVIESIC
jgi:hypothetical protein